MFGEDVSIVTLPCKESYKDIRSWATDRFFLIQRIGFSILQFGTDSFHDMIWNTSGLQIPSIK
jgi:hypothetical protein